MKTCIYCGDIVSFKGHGEITCIDCIEKLKKEEPEPKTPIVTVIGRGYPHRYMLSQFKSNIKVEKL
ncbi:hypothetical protein PP657_gp096 [Bacillus phage BCPST]|uniref:Uncharacterized protein n=2 Tax=Yihwangvirus TaxID=3044863 RepID=A0AAE7TQ89_9CAUD|nr:hypothetical protein PP655_gp104 [Bacillus phage PBC4]YP_010657361.1 hypothetical protein PP657_gp096 [Bacillus phage BCPST]AKQ08296.1 hypothetical protein PBC4_104 [Bacillus phage PBC4]QQO38726.1 hypothetical protein BCPST_108 [Bacillus phage BCPST]